MDYKFKIGPSLKFNLNSMIRFEILICFQISFHFITTLIPVQFTEIEQMNLDYVQMRQVHNLHSF